MAWLELTIRTSEAGTDTVAAILTANGFEEFVLDDPREFATILLQNRAYWDRVDSALEKKLRETAGIRLYLPDTDTDSLDRLNAILAQTREKDPDRRLGSLLLSVHTLEETDWSESWKKNYPPQPVGDTLTVLPYWLADTDIGNRLPIILDPGLTFGTGSHPTTQLVMTVLEKQLCPGSRVLDIGSGSGILSITALRLGAKSAVGVDLDPKASEIARQNAMYNGFGEAVFQPMTGNILSDRALTEALCQTPFDAVLVNIVADVILSLCQVLPRLVTASGLLILSGIAADRLSEVTAAVRGAGLTVTGTYAMETWRCITVKRGAQ